MTVCYHRIDSIEDTLKLQKVTDQLGIWARKSGMRFQPVKCNMIQLTRKWVKKRSLIVLLHEYSHAYLKYCISSVYVRIL